MWKPDLIYTAKGEAILVDPEDWRRLAPYRWFTNKYGYAVRTVPRGTIYMHREVMGVTDPKVHVDHRFHKKLDNRKSELRECTPAQNTRNQRGKSAGSGFKGVHRTDSKSERWSAHICVDRKQMHLGSYLTPEHAYTAYCLAAYLFHGEYAHFGDCDGSERVY
jgi:hypothetical protein